MGKTRRPVFYQLHFEKPIALRPGDWVLCDAPDDDVSSQRSDMLRRLMGDPRDPNYRRGQYYVHLYEYFAGDTLGPDGSGDELVAVTYFINSSLWKPGTIRELIHPAGQVTKETGSK
jgi:hypothetical protein